MQSEARMARPCEELRRSVADADETASRAPRLEDDASAVDDCEKALAAKAELLQRVSAASDGQRRETARVTRNRSVRDEADRRGRVA